MITLGAKLNNPAIRHDASQDCNADMESKEIKEFCSMGAAGAELLKTAMNRLGLSARAYAKILKVSRTIADLAGSEEILVEHLGEAIQYRSLDRRFHAI